MRIRHRIKRAFTLVEILIVVVILGILAAIVIPQFTSASQQAEAASVASQLQTIRSQVELFQVQHGGDYPFDSSGSLSESDWEKLTKATPKEGTPTGEGPYGPYFEEVPENGLAPSGSSNTGWHWDNDDKKIMAIVNTSSGEGTSEEVNAAKAAGLEKGVDWTSPSG